MYSANVCAHKLGDNHWYRNPEEGTRVCGNMSHWIDLFVNLIYMRNEIPSQFDINITHSDICKFDDYLVFNFVSYHIDLFNFIISSKYEIMDGVNELICISTDSGIAIIDDYRKSTIKTNSSVKIKSILLRTSVMKVVYYNHLLRILEIQMN